MVIGVEGLEHDLGRLLDLPGGLSEAMIDG